MNELKRTVGAILSLVLLSLIAFFGFGAVALAFSDGDGPGWAVIFLVMFLAPLLLIYGAVRQAFGLAGSGLGFGFRWRRKQSDGTLILPGGTVVRDDLEA